MISNKKTFCFDMDGTICSLKTPTETYSDVKPIQDMIDIINKLYYNDCYIIIHTARGMRTLNGNVSNINIAVRPELEEWLVKHKVNYHELIMGKPWGPNITYIDDKGINPEDFIRGCRLLDILKDPK